MSELLSDGIIQVQFPLTLKHVRNAGLIFCSFPFYYVLSFTFIFLSRVFFPFPSRVPLFPFPLPSFLFFLFFSSLLFPLLFTSLFLPFFPYPTIFPAWHSEPTFRSFTLVQIEGASLADSTRPQIATAAAIFAFRDPAPVLKRVYLITQ